MSGRVSPFAKLTDAEKQIKWLEYQSIRLPYVQGSVDADAPEQEALEEKAPAAPRPQRAEPMQPAPAVQRKTETPSPANPAQAHGMSPADFQRVRHRQYDAVIARMKQAERNASNYNSFS